MYQVLFIILVVTFLLSGLSPLIHRAPYLSLAGLASFLGISLGLLLSDEMPVSRNHQLEVLKLISLCSLSVAALGVGLETKISFLRSFSGLLGLLLLPALLLSWLFSFFGLLVTTSLSIAHCGILGAILAPSDPVVCSSLVTGKDAEEHFSPVLRTIIAVEAALNDGLASVLALTAIVIFPVYVYPLETDLVTFTSLKLPLSIAIGLGSGLLFSFLQQRLSGLDVYERELRIGSTALLAIALGVGGEQFDFSGILSAFFCGLVATGRSPNDEAAVEKGLASTLEEFLALPLFLFLGMIAPMGTWSDFGVIYLLTTLSVLLLVRRLPMMAAGWMWCKATGKNIWSGGESKASFAVLGPFGVAAIYYAVTFCKPLDDRLWGMLTFLVLGSNILYGLMSGTLLRSVGREKS